ncbi:hypothetical protein GOP47_0019258 [Adiantum capillus-veneris]|uniref:Lipoyl-binding domain-containing protein n=1 Tax=Adiantum capillus-veneris TaxID=13818 RepID=A0A9D4UEN4_ADICA|nr:hypothetical protein GOP47_0018548 [Adiantum capillus-veneris]KAI5066634.1 hypothetical protein GOP47_0019258 [Adiantum capillus-veneris]
MESLCAAAGSSIAAPIFNSFCSVSKSPMRGTFTSSLALQMQSPFCLRSGISSCVKPINAIASIPEKANEVEKEVSLNKNLASLAPNAFEVQSLLMEVCDETSIAELDLKVGAFKLHVKRDVGKLKGSAPAVPVAPPVPSKPMVESGPPVVVSPAPKSPSVSAAAILANPASKPGSRFGLLEAAADEGLLFATSPKVGLFRRSRVVKGKSGRPLCEEGQIVKEGQVVCYVEQLGTQQPVEAENSGEVVKILCKDGEPVGYGDPLIAIRPSFPGIK